MAEIEEILTDSLEVQEGIEAELQGISLENGIFYSDLIVQVNELESKFDDYVLITENANEELENKLADIKVLSTYNFIFFGVIFAALVVLIISNVFKRL